MDSHSDRDVHDKNQKWYSYPFTNMYKTKPYTNMDSHYYKDVDDENVL